MCKREYFLYKYIIDIFFIISQWMQYLKIAKILPLSFPIDILKITLYNTRHWICWIELRCICCIKTHEVCSSESGVQTLSVHSSISNNNVIKREEYYTATQFTAKHFEFFNARALKSSTANEFREVDKPQSTKGRHTLKRRELREGENGIPEMQGRFEHQGRELAVTLALCSVRIFFSRRSVASGHPEREPYAHRYKYVSALG